MCMMLNYLKSVEERISSWAKHMPLYRTRSSILKRQYKELRSHCYSFKTQLFKLVSRKLVTRKLVTRKLVSRLFLNLEKLLLTLGIKTTKKLVAMLVYLSKEYMYNSFVQVHQHCGHDVTCKRSIGLFVPATFATISSAIFPLQGCDMVN